MSKKVSRLYNLKESRSFFSVVLVANEVVEEPELGEGVVVKIDFEKAYDH